VADVDAATLHHPPETMRRLQDAGIRVVPTGVEHGTVTAVLPSGNVEITTLRRDVATDGRRATIAFADDWREDAARRDFTINALYAEPDTLVVYDWFGGLADLGSRTVRFIGEPEQRIREDHLRILRYYRFQARFGAALDEAAEEACAALAPMLKGLSRERVSAELLNLLALPDPHPTVARMLERGVLPVVLPETGAPQVAALERLIQAERRGCVAPGALRRLAALLPADPATAEQVAARLRLSKAQRKRLAVLAERATVAEPARALAYRIGREAAVDWLLLTGGELGPLTDWRAPTFPLKGGEIVARGVGAGPQVARILQAVERRWVSEGFPERARVEALLAEELAR
jgi:poly(A) polymerase